MSIIFTILFWLFIGLPFIFLGGWLVLFICQLIIVGILGLFYNLYDFIRSIAT